jgi:flagellar biosynthesis chaperone FliJ
MDAEQSAAECRRHWLQAKQRMDALQKAMNKFRLEELRQERKREQIITDEIARRKQQGF